MDWRFTTMNLHELVRRLQAGESRNAISRAMSLSVNTVTAYRRWAEAQNLLAGPLPDLATLERLRLESRWRERPGNERVQDKCSDPQKKAASWRSLAATRLMCRRQHKTGSRRTRSAFACQSPLSPGAQSRNGP